MIVDFFASGNIIVEVHRFLSTILFVCFGLLAPQVVPMRICLLVNGDLPSEFDLRGSSECGKSKCSVECGSTNVSETGSVCCLDFEGIADTTAPSTQGKRFAPALGVFFCIESRWIVRPVLTDAEMCLLIQVVSPPIPATKRQATLSVWTV